MKNSPLAMQIWLIFVVITLGVSLLFMLLVPWTLRDFFTRQTYATIREAQAIYLNNGSVSQIGDLAELDLTNQQYRSVNHVIFMENGTVLTGSPSVILQNMDAILKQAQHQQVSVQQYETKINGEKMYYVIRKASISGQNIFLFSYTWEDYQNDLIGALFSQLMSIIAIVLLFSWMPSFWLARYLTKPLTRMEGHVRAIADRDWYDPLEVDRNDEIGKLGQSIERMRQRLVEQNDMQRSFLQHISHELKTPVMVIRSYAQAIADGIFPKGGLEGSIDVIEKEAARMEKRVKDLLYLTKLDYLFSRRTSQETIHVGKLVQDIVEHLRWQRQELNWQIQIQDLEFKGSLEQWQVAIENLLDNQIRYADSMISISVEERFKENKAYIFIRIFNDGPPLEKGLMDKLFEEYQQGYRGEFGLGLAIVQEIAAYHNAVIWASNEEDGVAFYIKIPIGD